MTTSNQKHPSNSPTGGKGADLFLTGFLQVLFVAMNTYFITRLYWYGIFSCGFVISFIWAHNVKKIAFGTNLDRFYYAAGAALGSLAGVMAARIFLQLHIK